MNAPAAQTGRTDESIYVASQWKLMGRRFRRHRMAVLGGTVLALLYSVALFCEFLAPSDLETRHVDYVYCPPQRLRFFGRAGLVYVYDYVQRVDPVTLQRLYAPDETRPHAIRLLARGPRYRMWGLLESDLHLFGTSDGAPVFLLGADRMGRDLLSRVIYGARVSLSIGLAGVFLSVAIGLTLGGLAGYLGGGTDSVIQRVIEVIRSFPTVPLWMALSAAVPSNWPALNVYFGITIVLSLVGWTDLARVVRGKLLSLRGEDYVLAAVIAGCPTRAIVSRHLLPGFFSYIIVSMTLAIPHMILGETALSFLGLGLRPPVTSWGVLLKDAQNVTAVALYPWILLPVFPVIVTVLSFNFLGDGLRDAADPYR